MNKNDIEQKEKRIHKNIVDALGDQGVNVRIAKQSGVHTCYHLDEQSVLFEADSAEALEDVFTEFCHSQESIARFNKYLAPF